MCTTSSATASGQHPCRDERPRRDRQVEGRADLGIDAGERLTVTRRWRQRHTAVGGRGLDAVGRLHARPSRGRPLTAKRGSPWAMWASTSTTHPSRPRSATDLVRPRLISPPHGRARSAAGPFAGRRMPMTSIRTPDRAARRGRRARRHASRRSRAALRQVTASNGCAEGRAAARLDLADDETVAVDGRRCRSRRARSASCGRGPAARGPRGSAPPAARRTAPARGCRARPPAPSCPDPARRTTGRITTSGAALWTAGLRGAARCGRRTRPGRRSRRPRAARGRAWPAPRR